MALYSCVVVPVSNVQLTTTWRISYLRSYVSHLQRPSRVIRNCYLASMSEAASDKYLQLVAPLCCWRRRVVASKNRGQAQSLCPWQTSGFFPGHTLSSATWNWNTKHSERTRQINSKRRTLQCLLHTMLQANYVFSCHMHSLLVFYLCILGKGLLTRNGTE